MDLSIQSPDESIREIEDIINIQKANGNFNGRQVAFTLPEEKTGGGGLSAGLARSHESGLTRNARARRRGKKRHSGKWCKSALSDNVSWPSDSDITVLRMKASQRAAAAAPAGTTGDVLAGDGLHRADGSSMVNLATLVLPAQSASKHSLVQELLLPLSSWERPASPALPSAPRCNPLPPETSAKSRFARFLRLYFCPCCTCLYEMEKNMRDEHSIYLNSTRRSLGTASD